MGDANWRVEDGPVADSGLGQLVTKSFSDFQIQLEFWTDAGANSGVFIRTDPDNITDKNAYEANIFDTRPDQTYVPDQSSTCSSVGNYQYAEQGTILILSPMELS